MRCFKAKTAGVILSLVTAVLLLYGCQPKLPSSKDYCQKLYNSLTETAEITLGDVFGFAFDRVYFINENYMDGPMFSERYGLNLNIPQVEESSREDVRRAVFVDENGNFIYEFKCEYSDKVLPYREGIVAYPETKLRLVELYDNKVKKFEAVNAQSFLPKK